MTYNVFGGTLNPTLPCYVLYDTRVRHSVENAVFLISFAHFFIEMLLTRA